MEPLYRTDLGKLYNADSLRVMAGFPDGSIDLIVTSPPYALHFTKEYGNATQAQYVDWFLPFAKEFKRILKPQGSFVLNIGGVWRAGAPVRSLYHYRLVLALCDDVGFNLCQEFFWVNPAKMPAPAEWVNVRRIRVKDSTEYIFWFSTSEFPKADNRNVLGEYSPDMKRLIKRGLASTKRPSGHIIKPSFAEDKGGAIPGNVIICGNNESNSSYIKRSKATHRKIHPARFPAELPRFFIEFLTAPGDMVLDPFAGSNTTGMISEQLGRKWIAIEKNTQYAYDSHLRFQHSDVIDEEQAESNATIALQRSLFA